METPRLTRVRAARTAVISLVVAVIASIVIGVNVTPAAANACPEYQFVGVRGSAETNDSAGGYGATVDAVRAQVLQQRAGGAASFVDYPAIPVDFFNLKYNGNYRASVNKGINVLSSLISAFHTRCKNTPITIVGYSQGAHVAGDVYQSISQAVRDKIVALVMLGDPRFNPAQHVDYGNWDGSLSGSWNSAFAGGSVRSFQINQLQSVHSYCLKYDVVCNWSTSNLLNCKPGFYCTHVHYIDFGYTDDAAKWILSRLPAPAAPPVANNSAAAGYTYHVYHTGGVGLKIRSVASTAGSILGVIPEGGSVTILCQVHGQRVVAETDIWDRLVSGGYLYDEYVSTQNTGIFSIRAC